MGRVNPVKYTGPLFSARTMTTSSVLFGFISSNTYDPLPNVTPGKATGPLNVTRVVLDEFHACSETKPATSTAPHTANAISRLSIAFCLLLKGSNDTEGMGKRRVGCGSNEAIIPAVLMTRFLTISALALRVFIVGHLAAQSSPAPKPQYADRNLTVGSI